MGNQRSEASVLRMGGESTSLDYSDVRKAVLVLRAVNHDLRQQMIALLVEHGRLTVTDLYIKLRLEQSVASQHLAILRRAGVVNTDRDGKYIYYSINPDRIEQIGRLTDELAS